MAWPRPVYVLGGAHTPYIGKFHPDFIWKGHPDFGKRGNPTLEHYVQTPALDALSSAGLAPADVDRAWVGNFVGELFSSQGHLGAVLAGAHPDLAGKFAARVEGACASGGLAVAAGVESILAGADVVLVVGAEVQTTASAKTGADYLARAADYARQREIDPFTFPCLFGRRTRALTEAGQVTEEDRAALVVKAYGNAARNPMAHMHARKATREWALSSGDDNPTFLEDPEGRDFLKVSDCSQVSDGGSAIVLASARGLERSGKKRDEVAEIRSLSVATAPLGEPSSPLTFDTVARAAQGAYEQAALAPTDMGVAEVHDCFTVAEILMYEALGFADPKQGARLVREGATTLEGRLPVNTGGGLLAFGHPVGATGVKQIWEVSRQILGQCGDYQVASAPSTGIAANMGGDDRTAVVTIITR